MIKDKVNLEAPISAMFNKAMDSSMDSLETGLGTTESADFTKSHVVHPADSYSGWYWRWFEPYKEYHYCHHNFRPSGDDFELSFKIARKLCEKKLIQTKYQKTIGDFFKLMDIILKIIKD